MKRLLFALALATAPLALSACASAPRTTPAASYAAASTRAMLAAESAFNVAATAELDAKATGLLTGAKADQADAIRRKSYQQLVALRTAYNHGQPLDALGLITLTNQLMVLSGAVPAAGN